MYPCRFCLRNKVDPPFVVTQGDFLGWDDMFTHLKKVHHLPTPVNLPIFMIEWERYADR